MTTAYNQKPWFVFSAFIILDIFIVLLHIWGGFRYDLLNLDLERNIPTVYQTIKYIFIGFMSFGVILQMKLQKILDWTQAIFWSVLGSSIVFLGLDEIGELHENLEKLIKLIYPNIETIFNDRFFSRGFVSSPWILYVSLALILLSPFMLWFLWFSIKKFKYRNFYIIFPIILFVSVIVLEYIATSWVHPWIYNTLVVIEEYFEMLGISILSIFVSIEFFTQEKNLTQKLHK